MAIGKKVRFDVFKRDGFACQYCGRNPPSVVLEVDHIQPVSGGGSDHKDNLITACFDCNRGKGAERLTTIPATVAEKAEIIAEKIAQAKAYERLRKRQAKLMDAQIDEVEAIFKAVFNGSGFSCQFRQSVGKFIDRLGIEKVIFAFSKASAKINKAEKACQYACGICWNMIKEGKQ